MGNRVFNRVTVLAPTICSAALFVVAGCTNRSLGVVEPQTQTQITEDLDQGGATKLDLLFVIDNSGSMEEEQAELGRRVEEMIHELINPTPREDGDTPEPVTDMHLAVITTDMGTGGHYLARCDNPEENDIGGDRGAMQGHDQLGSCAENFAPFASYNAETNATPIWQQFACVANLGTRGCGLEQPLESVLTALPVQSE